MTHSKPSGLIFPVRIMLMIREHRAGAAPKRHICIFTSVSVILSGLLACRPVLAIGWGELLAIFLIMAVLLGPPLFRFWLSLSDFRDFKHNKKK
jgi:hypothetical protein